MKEPILSAVMLVYNGESYLKEAIDSVLKQNFKDFELIIINDGSVDRSLDIINQYSDGRIRVINNVTNMGIPYSRNIGLKNAKGEYLAWCDCDDINYQTRFEEQIDFLKANREYGVCGTWQLSHTGKKYAVHQTQKEPDLVKAGLLFLPSIMNPTSMLRLSLIRKNNLSYDTNLAIAEDHDFFLRCSMVFPLTNVQKVLVKYRASETSIIKKFKSKETESEEIRNVIHRRAINYLGIEPNECELIFHSLLVSNKKFASFAEFESCYNWLVTLKQKNLETKIFDQNSLNKVLGHRFYVISKKASLYGLVTFKYFIKKSHKSFGHMSFKHAAKLAFLCFSKNNSF